MPTYECRLIECGRVIGNAEVYASNQDLAWELAQGDLDLLHKGQWAEVTLKAEDEEDERG